MRFLYPVLAAFAFLSLSAASPLEAPVPASENATISSAVSSSCFPALGFNPPKGRAPSVPAYKWWCSREADYAFLGFSYSIEACPSRAQMVNDFKAMRAQYKARYVRIYSACYKSSAFYDQIVAAAYEAGIGVYALVWFGFNGPNDKRWEKQLDGLVNTLTHNRLASYVIRSIAIGSEPLFDGVIAPSKLAGTIQSVRAKVKWLGVEVTTSDMAYQFAQHNDVLNAADHVQMNVLPFFAQSATYGNSTQAKAQVLRELRQMQAQTRSRKKIIMTQTGWPSNQAVWKANSHGAEASLRSEQKYYDMLDGQCWTFKTFPRGGVGWFAQIWEDDTLPGWGIVKNGKPKFVFKPKTHC